MTRNRKAPILTAWIAAVVALMLTAAPVMAQQGLTSAPPGASAPADPNATPDAPPVTDMAWPTADDSGGGMMGMNHRPKPTTFGGRLVAWLGAWHPAVIHFPIALLLTVAFLELAAAVRRKPLYTASNKLLLGLATLGAVAAAPLGWMDAGLPTAEDSWALNLHRWMGTAIPFLLLALWWLKRPAEQAALRASSRSYEWVLAASVVVILAQAYLGGEVTHGANHMAF